ncbi:MAG TPA: tRNA pseudouridine(55) synthase TruB [Polyangiaceae bacterium]|nr:tRNA pseudouridine(55) synthase TruB [Polyangiaceae bacterium]
MSGGVFVVDKPSGCTSHTVVAQARRRLGTRAVGHAGTLDPMATGVLLLLVDEGTKLSPYLSLETKAYRAEILFGRATDTLDTDGKLLREAPVPPGALGESPLQEALAGELARTEQVPPAVSAIQIGGQRAHALARRGEAVDLPPRVVRVESLELRAVQGERIELEVRASKGYYVRALARDLGERLGLPACLSALRRTESGAFTLGEAWPWPLPADAEPLSLVAAVKRCLPCVELTAEGERKAALGQGLAREHFVDAPGHAGTHAWLHDGKLVAVGAARDDSFRVVRGFGRRG